MKLPKNWYVSALELDVIKELDKNKLIKDELGSYYNKFVKFAAIQRVTYEADLNEEYQEFIEEVLKKKMYNTDVKLWKKISKEIFVRDKYTCSYCRQLGGILEDDHVVPISKGGTNEKTNLTTSCRKCNRQKKGKTVEEFLKWREEHGK